MYLSDKQKKILMLLSDGQFHSGTELAEALGVSRSAICKQFKSLSELGIQHSAISGKGYRLDYALELLEYLTLEFGSDPNYNFADNIIESLAQVPQIVEQGLKSLSITNRIRDYLSADYLDFLEGRE